MTGRLRNGSMVISFLSLIALSMWVLQVHLAIPFTVIAQEPHMPTRQAKR
jgi:hypothetical protein